MNETTFLYSSIGAYLPIGRFLASLSIDRFDISLFHLLVFSFSFPFEAKRNKSLEAFKALFAALHSAKPALPAALQA